MYLKWTSKLGPVSFFSEEKFSDVGGWVGGWVGQPKSGRGGGGGGAICPPPPQVSLSNGLIPIYFDVCGVCLPPLSDIRSELCGAPLGGGEGRAAAARGSQQEQRPQRPTENSNSTQHAKGRTGDCPGPCKGTPTRRTVIQGAGQDPPPTVRCFPMRVWPIFVHPPTQKKRNDCVLRADRVPGPHQQCPGSRWHLRIVIDGLMILHGPILFRGRTILHGRIIFSRPNDSLPGQWQRCVSVGGRSRTARCCCSAKSRT